MAPIISFLIFSACCFPGNKLWASEFQLQLGDDIRVISDKAYRRSQDNIFEAVGNVIITHDQNAIYGEKASLDFATSQASIVGNVRYVGPDLTLYGSELHYDLETEFLTIQNARIVADNYIVLGREIIRKGENEIIAKDAEYTTCRDCPESWSVVGSEVRITLGEYIYIRHAYIKAKGVVIMYVPYVVLPIKKERETGLLFPNFSMRLDDGMRFHQPFFWAISEHKDLTLTPSSFGQRGVGTELQYRQMLGERRWFEANSLMSRDRIYDPENPNAQRDGVSFFRNFYDYEHHYQFSNNLSHHFFFSDMRDLDMVRDYDYFLQGRQKGSEVGGAGFVDWRQDRFSLAVEGHFNRNQLTPETMEFDDDYVQILPKISFALTPHDLIRSNIPLFNRWTFDLTGDYTIFRQNKVNEAQYVRNAQRINTIPRLDIDLFRLGPVSFKTQSRLDYQYYHFPEREEERFFSKWAHIQESEASFELQKIFGVAYRQQLTSRQLEGSRPEQRFDYFSQSEIIGELPRFQRNIEEEVVVIEEDAYMHSQRFHLKHFYLVDERTKGSPSFLGQIQDDRGQFDQTDALRRSQHLNNNFSRTQLPLANTVELQWNNSLIKKSARNFDSLRDGRYLRDNFNYQRVAYFDVSQGYQLDIDEGPLRERLTRLHINTGFTVGRTTFSAQEYYFYDTQDHLFNISLAQRYDRFRFAASLVYDQFNRPADKRMSLEGAIKASETLVFTAMYDFDVEQSREVMSDYGVIYSPYNNCWKLGLNYERSQVEKRLSFNFIFNFNDNNFTSFTGF